MDVSVGGGAVCINSGIPGYHRWKYPTTCPFLAMEVNDLPPGYRFNPSDNSLIDDILEPMVEGKPTHCGKAVQNVENFYSSCPSELDGAKDILENKENSLHLFVRRNRMSKNGNKVSRAAKGGSWRARDKSEEITTKTGIRAKKGVYEYTPKHKSEECGVKWIMEEYVLDRGDKFEDYAVCKLRVARSGKRKKRAKKDADNAAEKEDSSRHGEGPKTSLPLPIQTNPPLPTQTSPPLPTQTNPPLPTQTSPPLPIQTNPPLPTQTNPPLPIENCIQWSDMELIENCIQWSDWNYGQFSGNDDGWL